MTFDWFRIYCLSKPAVEECLPFDEDTLVFKVGGKMFALLSVSAPDTANLKCSPQKAQELRAAYPQDVLPGYHMNKRHWNTVVLGGHLTDKEIIELIDHSYGQVLAGVPKSIRQSLGLR
ncbi:MAG: MmcQ/YjbR family DNA-binding protein [Bacteroidetes bacterium]|nr:MmcQ/YjbR family DNA-binding protein [Bacteroidota bacterium]